jgi:hypothetical protein
MGISLELRDLLLADEASNGVAGLRTDSEPMLDAISIKLYLRGLFQRIVSPHRFHNASIAGPRPLDDHDAVKRFLLLPNPG